MLQCIVGLAITDRPRYRVAASHLWSHILPTVLNAWRMAIDLNASQSLIRLPKSTANTKVSLISILYISICIFMIFEVVNYPDSWRLD